MASPVPAVEYWKPKPHSRAFIQLGSPGGGPEEVSVYTLCVHSWYMSSSHTSEAVVGRGGALQWESQDGGVISDCDGKPRDLTPEELEVT